MKDGITIIKVPRRKKHERDATEQWLRDTNAASKKLERKQRRLRREAKAGI